MPVSVLEWAAAVAVVAQIAVPLVLAWPAWRVEKPSTDGSAPHRRGGRGRRRPAEEAPPPTGPARAALSCPACQAPVPLLAASFPCPFCGAQTTAPAEAAITP